MAKPVVKTIHAFDATQSYFVEFTWSGNQAYNNRMILYDASTQGVVYDHTYSYNYYKLNHEIPAYTLDNNKQYAVQISVIDADGAASALSDKYYFWTIETPSFYFEGLSDGDVILSPSITLNLHYSQSGTEELVWTKFFLYDASKTEITETDADYAHSLTHTFGSLENRVTYHVRATAVTVHGMSLDTGYISFQPSYANPSAYARLYADPDAETGFVNYYSNLVIITPDENDYTYEDGYIDLTEMDLSTTTTLRASSNVNGSMGAYWMPIGETAETFTKTENADVGMSLTGYSIINEVIVAGSTTQTPVTVLRTYQSIVSITNSTLYVNRIPFENITDGMRLSKLPYIGEDYILMRYDGRRVLVRNVGEFKFTIFTNPVRTERVSGAFITYYDVGAMPHSYAGNMFCTCIPVNSGSTTSIELDDSGFVKIIWRSDSGVTTERQALEFFRDNNVTILYPLEIMKAVILKQLVPFPRLDNYKLLRYSQSLTIDPNTTFMVRMKSCRKSVNFLKVYSGDEINFMLSGRVYEDGTFRLKLTVFNGGPTYTQYSEPLDIDANDIVTAIIRRVGGIYGLYVATFEYEDIDFRNMWLGDTEPSTSLTEKDLWIDLNQVLVYIPENEKELFYQDREPGEADDSAIWIGGPM